MKNIALAMSGGGFRAAAFSLGTLSYLNELQFEGKPLLENVSFIGSTSGGTLASIAYSLGVYQGRPFSQTYQALLGAMDGESLIADVFKILKDPDKWKDRGEKSRNLINAFSIAYDEFFGHAEFNSLFEPPAGVTPHLREICVNATEFSNGLSFRFQSQKKGKVNGLIGNFYVFFNDITTGGQLLLGDLMACSSCFSGGFEPFIFPDDFVHNGLSRTTLSDGLTLNTNPFTLDEAPSELYHNQDFHEIKNRFGIMDGGIADNQAIDSVLLANTRHIKSDPLSGFDLIILTDVTDYFIDGYTLPLEKKKWYNAISTQQIINIIKLTGLVFVFIIGWAVVNGWCSLHNWMRFVFIPTGLFAIGYVASAILLRAKRKAALKDKSTWLVIMFNYINYFLTIRVSRLKQMITSRLKSVFLLADGIYLKQIRRLYYEKIYNDPVLSKITVSNAIYDLSKAKQKAKDSAGITAEEAKPEVLKAADVAGIAPPADILIDVAEKARLMPTTLWFDQFQKADDTLKAIVATGQFTVCYNLLKHLTKKGLSQPLPPSELQLLNTLTADWAAFNQNPYQLYNKL